VGIEFVEPAAQSDGDREWFGSRGSHRQKKSIRADCPKQDSDAVDVRAPRAAQSARDFSARAAAAGVLAVWGMWGHAPYVERSSCSTMQRAADDVCCVPMCADEKT
jgi:hypothetical protein